MFVGVLRGEDVDIGRFKVMRLIQEASWQSKQPGKHQYKVAACERVDIPNTLGRDFHPGRMSPVWTIDITYIRAGRCIYLASVLDLYVRRVVDYAISDIADAALAIAALDMAWQQCVKPKGGHISFCASKQRWRIGCSQGAIRSNKNESLWKSLR